jgi:hypothetical protein
MAMGADWLNQHYIVQRIANSHHLKQTTVEMPEEVNKWQAVDATWK